MRSPFFVKSVTYESRRSAMPDSMLWHSLRRSTRPEIDSPRLSDANSFDYHTHPVGGHYIAATSSRAEQRFRRLLMDGAHVKSRQSAMCAICRGLVSAPR